MSSGEFCALSLASAHSLYIGVLKKHLCPMKVPEVITSIWSSLWSSKGTQKFTSFMGALIICKRTRFVDTEVPEWYTHKL